MVGTKDFKTIVIGREVRGKNNYHLHFVKRRKRVVYISVCEETYFQKVSHGISTMKIYVVNACRCATLELSGPRSIRTLPSARAASLL